MRGGRSAVVECVGEECAGVVKTPTFDAELMNVKTAGEDSTDSPRAGRAQVTIDRPFRNGSLSKNATSPERFRG